MVSRLALASLFAAPLVAACGDNDHLGVDAAVPDAAIDAGFVPASHPSQPTVVDQGSGVLAAPTVVPIFFVDDDVAQATLEDFLSQLSTSSYWTAIAHEYGVGALTVSASVVENDAAPQSDAALQTMLTAKVASHQWPAADANTIYAVFLPDGVTLTTQGGTSCVDFGGYHDATPAGLVYALMPRCTSQTFSGLGPVTIATAHELIEASTDPHPGTGYAGIDDDDAIWQFVPGAEVGDMCEFARAAYQPLVGPYMVQRTWSNASAAAGHDPCVPALATPYVEAVTNLSDITISAGPQSVTTRGIQIPVGTSKTVEVDLYSDAPAADWTVEAFDVASKLRNQPAELSFAFDKTTGHNGDKLQLTITRVAASTTFGVSELGLVSKVNGVSVGTWWALVTQ